jgi:hypothetical protein
MVAFLFTESPALRDIYQGLDVKAETMRTRLLAMGSVVLGMVGVGQAQDIFFSWHTDAEGVTMRAKQLTMCAVMLGMAGVCQAQDAYFTWSNDSPPGGIIGVGATVILTLEATWTPDPGFGFGDSLFDIIGDDIDNGGSLNHDEALGFGPYFPGAAGTTVGDDIIGIDEYQLPQAFGGGDPTNPISLFYTFEYTVVDDEVREVTYTSVHQNADIYQDAFGTAIPYNIHVTPTTFGINIPSPSGVALLGLGGFIAVRRRR